MDVERATEELTERKVVRRGMITGIAALGAAAMVKLSGASKAEAAHQVEDVGLNIDNTPTAETKLSVASPGLLAMMFKVLNGSASSYSGIKGAILGAVGGTDPVPIFGVSGITEATGATTAGVFGQATTGTGGIGVAGITSGLEGVHGEASGAAGFGVRAVNTADGTALKAVSNTGGNAAADGNGSGVAIVAKSTGNHGIVGFSGSAVSAGVYGENTFSLGGTGVRGKSVGTGGFGLLGESFGAAGIGVRAVNTADGTGLWGESNTGGISVALGNGSGNGVHGLSSSGNGVFGEATTGQGVRGYSNTAPGNGDGAGSGIGVNGKSGSGTGVHGVSGSGPGVKGTSTSAPGVRGESSNGPGVFGISDNQPGLDGVSNNSLGIRGTSTNFVGILGLSTNGHGLYGSTTGSSAFGIVAENKGTGPGLLVTGNAQIFGALQVFGVKNAVIKMQDGTNAAVYCQESPEPYFEDFGRGQLAGGVANVPLEREFAQLVAGNDYMVFCFPQGDTRGLFVSRQTPAGFEVRELQGGTGNVPFTYRIVTRRKDVDARRFARVNTDAANQVASARAALTARPGNNVPPPSTPAPGPVISPPAGLPGTGGATPGPGLTVRNP